MKRDDQFNLTKTGFTVLSLEYTRVRDIMAEFDSRESILRDTLLKGYGVEITDQIAPYAVLHVIVDEQMSTKMHENKIHAPTIMQLIGTSRCISLSEKDAIAQFRAMMKGEN